MNKQDPVITLTVEFEDYKQWLNFLDTEITNNSSNRK